MPQPISPITDASAPPITAPAAVVTTNPPGPKARDPAPAITNALPDFIFFPI